jgi:predicted nucleotidyltransferase
MPSTEPAALADLVATASAAYGDDLQAVVLFGSAAEDRVRAVSDLNLIIVLRRFDAAHGEAFGHASNLLRTALRARIMHLLASEIPRAAAAFPVKFADILRRRRVLHGADPFADLVIPRDVAVAQLRQALLDLTLRQRERLVSLGGTPDRLAHASAEAAGALRACAAELLALEGAPAPTPREALQRIAGDPLDDLVAARAERPLPAEAAKALFMRLMATVEAMTVRAEALA